MQKWKHEPEFISAERKRQTGNAIIRTESGDYVTTVQMAIAPIVAAAPAMLAALKSVVDAWRDEMESDSPIAGSDAVEWLCNFYCEAESAIAAATGSPGGTEAAEPVTDFAGHAAAIMAAQGYVSGPDMWNAPSPEQVAHLLRLCGMEAPKEEIAS